MLLTDAYIYTEDSEISDGWLEIRDGKIHAFGEMKTIPLHPKKYSCQGKFLLPGFIDQHTHGIGGHTYMYADKKQWNEMVHLLPSEGITSFLPTTATTSVNSLKKSLVSLGDFCKHPIHGLPEALGIHLEGPFLEAKYCGAQNPEYLLTPSVDTLKQFNEVSSQQIRLITIAPELVESPLFFDYLNKNNIVISAGHSGAGFSQIEDALSKGLRSLTHFHNACSPHHHRTPGVVSAGLMFDELFCELIVDGNHLHPDVVRLMHKVKGTKGIILITDALKCKGLPDGNYEVDGIPVIKKNNEIRMVQGGALAGSILAMNKAADNYCKFTGASLRDITQVCSENPARLLGFWNRKGSISVGKDADLIVCDENININQCFCRGIPTLDA